MKIDERIFTCLQSIQSQLKLIQEDDAASFAEKSFLHKLEEAEEILNKSLRNSRPDDLPEDLVWSDKPYDPDELYDPFSYDGSMTPEEFVKIQDQILQESKEGGDTHGTDTLQQKNSFI